MARTLEVVQTIRFHGNQNFVAIRDVVPAHDPRPSFGATLHSLPLPEPQRSMTSRGYDPRQSPGLGYKRVVSCKDSFHGTDVLAVSEHGAPGRRPNIHAHFVGRQREDGLDTLPARAAEANRSTLIADIPFPAPENLAARGVREAKKKRSETVQDRGRFSSQDTRPV